MHRYDCQSQITVTCRNAVSEKSTDHVITTILAHHENHVPYYDVEISEGASHIICENLEWTTPVALVPKIQALYPGVTAAQVYAAWSKMSKTLWKRDELQLPPSEKLPTDYSDDVNIFDVPKVDGVQKLCWEMKRIFHKLCQRSCHFTTICLGHGFRGFQNLAPAHSLHLPTIEV